MLQSQRNSPPSATTAVLRRKFSTLAPEMQAAILDLANSHPEIDDPVYARWETNSLFGAEGGILCCTVARINHSCSFNAEHIWDPEGGVKRVIAVRDISEGSEIYLNYLGTGVLAPAGARQAELQKRFNFTCKCTACAAEDAIDDFERTFCAAAVVARSGLSPEQEVDAVCTALHVMYRRTVHDSKAQNAPRTLPLVVLSGNACARLRDLTKQCGYDRKEVGEW